MTTKPRAAHPASLDNPGTIHLPPSSVHVWLEGAALCIRLPNSHTLMVPTDRYLQGVNVGFAVFIRLLRERASGVGKIGTTSSPVQYDIDGLLRDYGKPVKKAKALPGSPEQRGKARDVLRRMKII